tara:strand:+ start:857 stop:1183 length:327 start_codon:yes stop_codon:yes gene_type:complete
MNRKVIPNDNKPDLIVFEGKLQYKSKAALESALKSRGILEVNEGQTVNAKGTHAVVHLGFITLKPATETSEAVISKKYHADIMTEKEYSFGISEVILAKGVTPSHTFG